MSPRPCPTAIRYCLFAVIAALPALTAAPAHGQVGLLAQSSTHPDGFSLRYRIAGGRLAFHWDEPQDSITARTSESNMGWGVSEKLSLSRDGEKSRLTYERADRAEQLTIDLAESTVSISHTPKKGSKAVAMVFKQVANEKTTLTLGSGDGRRVFRAGSLWQLWIIQPKECEQHLLPLLKTMRSDWKITETVATVEKKLVASVYGDAAKEHTRWAALVEQLGDERFARREAADRGLRAGGLRALSYLRTLDLDALDAEQQYRIARIIQAATPSDKEDSADAVAALLTSDPAVWLALLGRPEKDTRRAAADQLAALLGHPLDIDPAAEPDAQREKREMLRKQIEK